MKEEIRKEVKEEIQEKKKELKKEKPGIKEEIEEEEIKEDVEEEVKKELAEEGLGREERMSEIGERALEDRWFTFLVGLMFLLVLGALVFAVCYYAPHWVEEEEE